MDNEPTKWPTILRSKIYQRSIAVKLIHCIPLPLLSFRVDWLLIKLRVEALDSSATIRNQTWKWRNSKKFCLSAHAVVQCVASLLFISQRRDDKTRCKRRRIKREGEKITACVWWIWSPGARMSLMIRQYYGCFIRRFLKLEWETWRLLPNWIVELH